MGFRCTDGGRGGRDECRHRVSPTEPILESHFFLKKVTFTEGGTEAETSDDEIVDFDAPPGESGR